MPDDVHNLPKAFDDYYNRGFVPASLESRGLSAAAFPMAFVAGDSVTLTITDSFERVTVATFVPPPTVVDRNQLATLWNVALDGTSLGAGAVKTTVVGSEIRFELRQNLVSDGTSIRVTGGNVLPKLGLEGPLETPGDASSQASLQGKPVPGGFPLALAAATSVNLEVRDKDLVTRRYAFSVPAGTYNTAGDIAAQLVTAVNAEFPWVEAFTAGPDRIGLRVQSSFSGPKAAVRSIGAGPAALGLDGPIRTDGVVDAYSSNGIRGDSGIGIGEALSDYIAKKAAAMGIPVDAAHDGDLANLVDMEAGKFDCVMILLMDAVTGMPGGKRAWTSGSTYNVRLVGPDGHVFSKQLTSSTVIGEGSEGWQTYAHEFGHVLGCYDLYSQPEYDALFDVTRAYANAWSVMHYHPATSHIEGWHKNRLGYLPATAISDVSAPPAGATEHHRFTLVPMEFPEADYSSVGDPTFPRAQLVRINLSRKHWIGLENRKPGFAGSLQLPDDVNGVSPPAAVGQPGDVLVTDTVDPFVALFRPPVAIMNPLGAGGAGVRQARGLKKGDALPFDSTYPKYAGLKLDVVDEVPGPAGKPNAFKVDLTWGPGDFLDLEMRPWQAPQAYATNDIWIDWPGNGTENYSTSDPPLGNGDPYHWQEDGKVLNKIMVRVHNKGTILGKQVIIRCSVNDPIGVGDHGRFVPLPDSLPQDIPAGSFRDFAFDWFPTKNGHTCIRAEVFRNSSDLSDLDLENNATQENLDDFSPRAGSPYEPYDFTFKVTNNQTRPVQAEIVPAGLTEGMELELEQKYLYLPPQREVLVRGRLQLDTDQFPLDPARRNRTSCFNIHAFKRTQDSLLPWGGISISVAPGARSKLRFDAVKQDFDIRPPGYSVFGTLLGDYPKNETVDAAVIASDGKAYQGTAKTDSSGRFRIPIGAGVPPGKASVMIYYYGTKMASSALGPVSFHVP